MKKPFFLFSLLSLCISTYAQTNLDSLWSVWNDKTKADTIRLEAVHYFMQGSMNNEFNTNPFFRQNTDSLSALIKLVDEVTEASGSKKYALMAVRQKGIYLQNIQNLEEAVKLYAQALDMARTMQDKRLILMSTVSLANGEFAWGSANGQKDTARLAQAEKRYLEALNLFELESVNSDEVAGKPDPQLSHYAFVSLFQLGNKNNFLQNIPNAIQYLEKALALAERSGNKNDEGRALLSLGNIQNMQRDFPNARQYMEKAIILAQQSGDGYLQESAMGMLAGVFQSERNYPLAIRYYTKSLKLAEQKGDNHFIAHNLQSLGDLYTKVGEYAKAEDYLTRALSSMQAAGPQHQSEQLMMYAGLHQCYIEQKSFSKAIVNDSTLIKFAGEFLPSFVPVGLAYLTEDYYKVGDYVKALEYGFQGLKANDEMAPNINTAHINNRISLYIGNTYRKQNLPAKAITWCKKASTDHFAELQKDACECLYESYKALKQGNEALVYHEKFLVLTDSLNTNELGKTLQKMEFSAQLLADSMLQQEERLKVEMAHESEMHQKNNQRNVLLGSGFIVLLLAGGLWSRLRFTRRSKATLQVEKDRSENLLLNILPAEVAEELKLNGKAAARDFDMVSIIFTDFQEFTQTSEKISASELVDELNHCFEGFDAIMEKFGIEKIKTIGDAYMAAGGLPVPSSDSVKRTVRAALEMQSFISKRKAGQDAQGLMAFEMRAGIHTGPVVAGIVGVKKFQYDIWGDTVNTASRMESVGELGQVNISQDTYELIKDDTSFSFEKRGRIEVKGKGQMEMYFVSYT